MPSWDSKICMNDVWRKYSVSLRGFSSCMMTIEETYVLVYSKSHSTPAHDKILHLSEKRRGWKSVLLYDRWSLKKKRTTSDAPVQE